MSKLKRIIKVSIIVPVYNVEKYLPQCLDSLVSQTLKDIEIICIDDCSTDNSLNILKKYADIDNRIKIFENKKNIGVNANLNFGISIANGEYIGFIGSDDYVNKNYFCDLYYSAIGADVCLTTSMYNVYDKGKYEKKYMGNIIDMNNVTIDDKVNMLIASASPCNKIYKKSFVLQNKLHFINTRTRGGDLLFTAMGLVKANTIIINNQAGYYYRQLNGSMAHKRHDVRDIINVVKSYNDVADVINKDKTIPNYNKYMFIAGLKCRQYSDYNSCYNNASDDDKKILQKYYNSDFFNNVIVSLTSYPARIKTVDQTIKTLLNQSYKPNKVILWLASTQFPNKEKDLPKNLLALCKKGLTISWYNRDIKSYKKLIPTYKKFPGSIIVTADDDVLYPNNWLKLLLDSYAKHPFDINCHRCHRITFESKNKINNYLDWNLCYSHPSASFNNFFTGCGGVLYPAFCLYGDILNEKKFIKLAPNADDVWFWAMAILNGVKIRVVKNCISNIISSSASQDSALYKNNVTGCQNDIQIINCFSEYPQILKKLKYIKGKYKKWLIHKIKLQIKKIFRKERLPYGRRHIYFCGIKIFSYFSRKSLKFFDPIIKKHDSFIIQAKKIKNIILGSSRARDGFNPDSDGFNLGESSQDLYRSYMLYKWCINKSSVIKNVILFVDLWSPGFDLEKSSGESFKCVPYKYLFDIPYRMSWCDKKQDSFIGCYINRVINTKSDSNYYGKSLRNMSYNDVLPIAELVAKQIHYNQKATECNFIKDFIKLAKEHKHKLYIVFAPYRSDYLNRVPDISRYYKWVYDLTNNTDVKILNFLSDKDFDYNDFEDTRHLNESGAIKLTTKINKYLK